MENDKIRGLWRDAFLDSERYMDYYFSHKAPVSRLYLDEADGEPVSMAFFMPYTVIYRGEKCRSFYIEGVATQKKYRRQHRMKNLLMGALGEMEKQGVPFVFLCPETPSVYRSLGFVPVYRRETVRIKETYERGENDCQIRCFEDLSEKEKREMAEFASDVLAAEGFDLYMEHSVSYYEEISRELQALGGKLLIVYGGGMKLCAVVHMIHETKEYEIVEMLLSKEAVRPENVRKVTDAVLYHLNIQTLVIEDGWFLKNLGGIGIKKEPQEKPYIMCRTMNGESPEILCYINDIT